MLGGDFKDADFSLNTDALKAIYEVLGGEATTVADLTDIPAVISKIADVASGGGGGSSDFKTATVTVVNNLGTSISMYGAFCDSGDVAGSPASIPEFFVMGAGASADVTVIKYKGTAFIQIPQTNEVVLSGNITKTLNGFVVTGDGTMTIGTSGGDHPIG